MDSEQTSAPKSKRNLIVISAAAIVLAGAAAGWFFLHRHRAPPAPEPPKVESTLHLETFVVNLADEDGRTFLRIGIDLGLAKAPGKEKEGEATPVALVRDTILSALMARRSDELESPEGKEKLKAELLHALGQRAPELKVREIYFTEFLLQR